MAEPRQLDRPRPLRRGAPESILLVLAVLFVAVALVQILLFHYGRDQAIFSLVGRAIVEGGAPYRDAWDFKTPGIYFVYALARRVFGPGMHAVRLLEALACLSLVPAYVVLSKRHLGRPGAGVLAGAIALLYSLQLDFWHTAQPESFGGILVVWAIVAATYRPRPEAAAAPSRRFAAWSASGALYTMAALLKPPLGGGLVCSLLAITVLERGLLRRTGQRARALLPAAAFAAGAAVVVLACALFFHAREALPDLRAALFGFLPHYTAIDHHRSPFLALVGDTVWTWLFQVRRVASVAGTLGFLLLFLPSRAHPREYEAWIHALGAIAFQLFGVALQGKLFLYHFAGMLPLTALLAAWGYWKLLRFRGVGWAVAAVVTIAAGYQITRPLPQLRGSIWDRCGQRARAVLDPGSRDEINDRLHSFGDVNAGANRRAAAWIARHAPQDQPIYVWGFEPILYELSGGRPASRYLYNIPQRASWSAESARAELMDDLNRSSPSVIVVVRGDQLRGVVGNDRDSRQELARFDALREMIGSRYRSAVTIEDLELHLRADLAAPAPTTAAPRER